MSENLICEGNRVYSEEGRNNFDRAFKGKDIPMNFDDKYGFWDREGQDNGHQGKTPDT